MRNSKLSLENTLPLTCSRSGWCCHGNLVLLNPWELFSIAKEKKITPEEFRNLYCDFGGIQLRFNGKTGWKGQHACSQYVDNFGCSVYFGRPLACRLYPLGREIQNNEVKYIYQGDKFPCLQGCAEVLKLPYLSVGDYLEGQMTDRYETAQDEYLELMQNIADIAFELLLETGLAESGDKETLALWRKMGSEIPEELVERIGIEWIDCLMIPKIPIDFNDPVTFVNSHKNILQLKAQEKFGFLQTNREFHEASVLIMGVALYLATGLGANTQVLAEHWIGIAKNYGALE